MNDHRRISNLYRFRTLAELVAYNHSPRERNRLEENALTDSIQGKPTYLEMA